MSDGPIRVLKYGFIRTLERCPSLMNQRNAVGGDEFRHRVGRPYKRADPHLYESILTNGDEEKAIEFAAFRIEQHKRDGKKQPSEMCSATTVYVLVQEIREKTKGHSET